MSRIMNEESQDNGLGEGCTASVDLHEKVMRFTPQDAMELFEEITADHGTLKALGSLLVSFDLDAFRGEDSFAEDRRCGIERILTQYVDNQRAMLDAFWNKATNCPEWLISRAEITYNDVKTGLYGDAQTAINLIDKALCKLRAIITQFGPEEYPKVITLQHSLTEMKNYYAARTPLKKAV